MVTITSKRVTVAVTFPDAPEPVTGRTGYSGKTRTVRPEYASISGNNVLLRGPSVRADGSLSASHFEVVVTLAEGGDSYGTPTAPEWVAALVAEVLS